ncbi:MAG: tetratricopeptide repeat protein [Pirellulales bacterium]|nr:tetratricopeptide repeat protein [Pirellulales bacterium]
MSSTTTESDGEATAENTAPATTTRTPIWWRRVALVALLAIAAGAAVVWFMRRNRIEDVVTAEGAALTPLAVRNFDDPFAGVETCRECHADKVESFAATAHAQSLRVATGAERFGDFSPEKSVVRTRRDDLWYEVAANEQGMFQTSFEGTPQGMVRTTHRADLVMGSGKLALGYLYWHNDQLFQMPLVYFVPLESWTNAPGFSDRFAWWDRPISPRCLECHATYFEHVPGTTNSYRQDNFIAAISCERCHGRGSQHVAFHRAHPEATRGEHIVDPRLLSRQLQLDNCSLCHGAAGRPIKPSFSYAAGEALADSFRFDTSAADVGLVHTVNQLDRLSQSACFRKSPHMTCTTCHDPHVADRGDLEVYSQRCAECHAPESHPDAANIGPRLAANCIDCHLPFRDDESLTFKTSSGDKLKLVQLRDHLINVDAARSDGVLRRWRADQPDLTFQQRLADLASSRMAAAKTAHAQRLLQAGDATRARRFLDEAIAVRPDFAPAHTGAGILLLAEGNAAAARERFEQAVAADAKFLPAMLNLAECDLRDGRFSAARRRYEAVRELEPKNADAQLGLANCAKQQGEYAEAIALLQSLLNANPEHLAAVNNLGWLLATCPDERFRDAARALALAESLVRKPKQVPWSYWDTLAAAYSENRQFDQAIAAEEKALSLARSDPRTSADSLVPLAARLEQYRRGEPYRDAPPKPPTD